MLLACLQGARQAASTGLALLAALQLAVPGEDSCAVINLFAHVSHSSHTIISYMEIQQQAVTQQAICCNTVSAYCSVQVVISYVTMSRAVFELLLHHSFNAYSSIIAYIPTCCRHTSNSDCLDTTVCHPAGLFAAAPLPVMALWLSLYKCTQT
jgi:hypothetical protein